MQCLYLSGISVEIKPISIFYLPSGRAGKSVADPMTSPPQIRWRFLFFLNVREGHNLVKLTGTVFLPLEQI